MSLCHIHPVQKDFAQIIQNIQHKEKPMWKRKEEFFFTENARSGFFTSRTYDCARIFEGLKKRQIHINTRAHTLTHEVIKVEKWKNAYIVFCVIRVK